MPDPVQNVEPKGQARGEKKAQQEFQAQTPIVEEQESSTPLPSMFGDLREYIFSPTERPEEPVTTGFMPQMEEEPPPSDQYAQLLTDPRASQETKSILSLLARLRLQQPRQMIFDEDA